MHTLVSMCVHYRRNLRIKSQLTPRQVRLADSRAVIVCVIHGKKLQLRPPAFLYIAILKAKINLY